VYESLRGIEMKRIWFIAIIVAFLILSSCARPPVEESTPAQMPPSFQPTIFGDGEVLVTFEVKVPEWTPKEDKIYIYTDGYQPIDSTGIPMEKQEINVWSIAFLAPKNQELRYKYSRNGYGFATDEEFTPDGRETRHSIMVGTEPILVQDEVKKWRWLTEQPPQAILSIFRPDKLPEREETFITGVFALDFFDPLFVDFIPSVFDRIKEKGFKYVGIAYAPSSFISGKPLEFSSEPINTYTDEQLAYTIAEARKRGLKIVLSAGIETDPGNFDKIETEFTKEQSNEWYRELAKEWEDVMAATAKLAEEYEIEILTPSNQWSVWGNKTEEQKEMLNPLINEAYQSIRAVYSGIISSDYYNPDEAFDYYKQLDWIGDKWWWAIADKKETNIAEMKVESERIIDDIYRPIYEEYKKPIFIQQLAYASYDGAAGALQISTEGPEMGEWFPYNPEYPADFQEQADAYESVFQAIYDKPMFIGAFSFSYTYWDSYDKSAGIRGKPAEEVWVKWNSIFSE
jgi:hypothetical protein